MKKEKEIRKLAFYRKDIRRWKKETIKCNSDLCDAILRKDEWSIKWIKEEIELCEDAIRIERKEISNILQSIGLSKKISDEISLDDDAIKTVIKMNGGVQ